MKYSLIVFILALAACSSTPIEVPSQYLLRSSATISTSVDSAKPVYDLDNVEVAPYLDQPGLVLETANGEIHTARQHKWAEPLRLSLQRFMAAEIGAELDAPVSVRSGDINATRIAVSIDQLHGTRSGNARLVAFWKSTGPDGQLLSGQFSQEKALPRDGYAALVQAQQSLLQQLARNIGAALKQ